jgi:hypothetical protein
MFVHKISAVRFVIVASRPQHVLRNVQLPQIHHGLTSWSHILVNNVTVQIMLYSHHVSRLKCWPSRVDSAVKEICKSVHKLAETTASLTTISLRTTYVKSDAQMTLRNVCCYNVTE